MANEALAHGSGFVDAFAALQLAWRTRTVLHWWQLALASVCLEQKAAAIVQTVAIGERLEPLVARLPASSGETQHADPVHPSLAR